jgi:Predicted nucleotide-binding protein containing TIR -like domain
LQHILKPRARQNVILELGMLLYKFGENKLLILTERKTEPPSDLVGRYWEYIESGSDAQKRTREFVKSVSINAPGNLLSKDDLPIRFSELKYCSDIPIDTFEEEYAKTR